MIRPVASVATMEVIPVPTVKPSPMTVPRAMKFWRRAKKTPKFSAIWE
jgi:hypothetical protein